MNISYQLLIPYNIFLKKFPATGKIANLTVREYQEPFLLTTFTSDILM